MKQFNFTLLLFLTFSIFCGKKEKTNSTIAQQIEQARKNREEYKRLNNLHQLSTENQRHLYQRGDSLNLLADKIEETASRSEAFVQACQRLRKQQEEKPISGFAKIAACLCCNK